MTASPCQYYSAKWTRPTVVPLAIAIAVGLGGVEPGLVFALRRAREQGHRWPFILMAVLAALLLAGGVLRHYGDMIRTQSDAGISLRFALLDASGDVVSLLSVLFQPHLDILGLVIYGSELAIWVGLMGVALYYRAADRRTADGITEDSMIESSGD